MMEDFKDLKIVDRGVSSQPNEVDKSKIDLSLELSHQAPLKWCHEFNKLFQNNNLPISIDIDKRFFIKTTVKQQDEESCCTLIKAKNQEINKWYREYLKPDERLERIVLEEYRALRSESLRCAQTISNTV